MSSGSVLSVIVNTTKTDKLLYAQDFLKQRINDIIKNNIKITDAELLSLPKDDKYLTIDKSILPSMNELEKSHSVFINSSYRPSIPMTSEYIKVPYAQPEFDSTIKFQMPQVGNFTNDCVLHIRLSAISSKDYRDRVRYVAMLGHRLIEHVQFLVNNGNVVDEYGTDDYNAYYQYELSNAHKTGYLRNIGQEIPNIGYITGDPVMDMFQEYKTIGNGNQTLKYKHNSIDLFIPILFWFKDVRNALPRLPWGQLQLSVKLAKEMDIIGYYDGGGGGAYNSPKIEFCDLYVNQLFTLPEIFNLYTKKFVFSIIRTHKAHKEIIKINNSNNYKILLNNLKWPIELMYVSFRPQENITLSQFWHKNAKLIKKSYKTPVIAKDPSTVMSVVCNDDYPISNNKVSIALISHITSILSNVNGFYIGYDLIITEGFGYNSDIGNNKYTIIDYIANTATLIIDGVWYDNFIPNITTKFELSTSQLAINRVTYYQEESIVDSISIIAHDIEIFKSHKSIFYNSYLSSRFKNINTPDDANIYLIPLCINPYNHNPSGSINVSLVREFYIGFTSKLISSNYPVDLIVLARTINFLLVDANTGGLHLKYSI
jgi:hypothetical protein